jgi:hypothetical protein
MEASLDTILGNLNIHVFDQWMQDVAGTQNLVVLITESKIIGPQLEYLPEAYIHEEYEHNHMLRTSVSGLGGLSIANNPTTGEIGLSSYTYEWNNNWDWHNCYVVAFVVDGTNGEVLNAVEKKLDE